MNEKLDLTNLLKDCPKGMPLDCAMFDGSVTFNGIVDDDIYPIEIKIDNGYEERLNKYGGYNNSLYCKCVIFPKGKTTWEGFQRPFKDGDILYINCNDDEDTWKDDEDICKKYEYIFILKETTNDDEIHCYCYIDKANENNRFEMCWLTTTKYTPKFATKEEKQMLFDAIKAHGYKWNEETKSLDNLLVPKFNVGDIIRSKIGSQTYNIIDVSSEYYSVRTQGHTCVGLPIKDQDNWELVSNVTIPKFKDEDKNHLWTIQDAKEGDVLAINWYEGYDYWEKIVIFKKYHNEGANSPCVEGYGNTFKNRKLAFHEEVPRFSKTWTSCLEPATKEQRDLLFQTIKEAGYKWNIETKTLEKLIVPKFKVGDKIKHKDTVLTIITVRTDSYIIEDDPGNFGILMVSQQDNWELINEPKFKVGDRIRYAGEDFPIKIIDIKNNQYHIECFYDKYNDYKNGIIPVSEQNNYMLIPKFNPKTLQPFDRVLVSCNDEWFCDFFSHYDDAVNKFNCTCTGGCPYEYCIPYNDDTKHLIGKSIEDTPEFYKYWE